MRFVNDKLFRNMAISARNAAELASPISLPPGHYDAVMNIAITLDPKSGASLIGNPSAFASRFIDTAMMGGYKSMKIGSETQ